MKLTDIKQVRVGDILKWEGEGSQYDELYRVESIDYETGRCALTWDNSDSCDPNYDLLEAIGFNIDITIMLTEVKDTRLARKMYPDYKILDNGMLGIRS